MMCIHVESNMNQGVRVSSRSKEVAKKWESGHCSIYIIIWFEDM